MDWLIGIIAVVMIAGVIVYFRNTDDNDDNDIDFDDFKFGS
jgi:hypothetical protein